MISRFGVSRLANYSLKGVQYAAHRSASYKLGGGKAVHGWVYGFREPYQIFIIYMAFEKEGFDDLRDIMRIFASFQVVSIR